MPDTTSTIDLFVSHCNPNCPDYAEIARYYAEAGSDPALIRCADHHAVAHLRERHPQRK